MAASVLSRRPPTEGAGEQQRQAPHLDVSFPSGRSAAAPRLPAEKGGGWLVPAPPANPWDAKGYGDSEGGAGLSDPTGLRESSLYMVHHHHAIKSCYSVTEVE